MFVPVVYSEVSFEFAAVGAATALELGLLAALVLTVLVESCRVRVAAATVRTNVTTSGPGLPWGQQSQFDEDYLYFRIYRACIGDMDTHINNNVIL